MTARNVIRGQEAWTLSLLRSQGKETEAQEYLESLNKGCRIFGNPEWEMPEPLSTDMPDLVSCPADRVTAINERELRRTMEIQRRYG